MRFVKFLVVVASLMFIINMMFPGIFTIKPIVYEHDKISTDCVVEEYVDLTFEDSAVITHEECIDTVF